MPHYRLYFLNRATGGIQRHEEFDAPGDDGAIGNIRKAFRWHYLELWCGARLVWSSGDAGHQPSGRDAVRSQR